MCKICDRKMTRHNMAHFSLHNHKWWQNFRQANTCLFEWARARKSFIPLVYWPSILWCFIVFSHVPVFIEAKTVHYCMHPQHVLKSIKRMGCVHFPHEVPLNIRRRSAGVGTIGNVNGRMNQQQPRGNLGLIVCQEKVTAYQHALHTRCFRPMFSLLAPKELY